MIHFGNLKTFPKELKNWETEFEFTEMTVGGVL